MEFKRLSNIILPELERKLKNSDGLPIFEREQLRFECWIKVELTGILLSKRFEVCPEYNINKKRRTERIDIHFEDGKNEWGLELKTIPTNYKQLWDAPESKRKSRPITYNLKAVAKDVKRLKGYLSNKKTNKKGGILLIVYPLNSNNDWKNLLNRNTNLKRFIKTADSDSRKFKFKGTNSKGVIYFGEV